MPSTDDALARLLAHRALVPAPNPVGPEGLFHADDRHGTPWAVVVLNDITEVQVRELFRDARGRRLLVGCLSKATTAALATARRLGIELLDSEGLERLAPTKGPASVRPPEPEVVPEPLEVPGLRPVERVPRTPPPSPPPPPKARLAPPPEPPTPLPRAAATTVQVPPPPPRMDSAPAPLASVAPKVSAVLVPVIPETPEESLARGEYEAALAGYRLRAQENPGLVEPRLQVADLLHRLHRYAEELGEYEALQRLGADSARLRIARGAALHRLGRFAEAIAVYDALLEAFPENANAWNNRGAAFLALGKKEPAAESLERALYFDPDLEDARQNLALVGKPVRRRRKDSKAPWRGNFVPQPVGWAEAVALSSFGLGRESLVSWEKNAAPEDGRAWLGLSSTLRGLGHPEAADRALEKAVSLGDPAARLTQAASLVASGKAREAQALLEPLSGLRGRSARGSLAIERGDAAEALAHFTATATLAGEAELPWNAVGGAELRRGNYRNALEAFDRALAVDAGYALAVNNRGVALWRLGRLREAAEAFDEAVHRDGGAAEFWVNLGIARAHAGAEKLALRAFETAARLAPEWPKPLVEIARLRRRRGDKRGAKRFLGRAVKLGWRTPSEGRGSGRGSRRGSA